MTHQHAVGLAEQLAAGSDMVFGQFIERAAHTRTVTVQLIDEHRFRRNNKLLPFMINME
jgi:hypothetical protein